MPRSTCVSSTFSLLLLFNESLCSDADNAIHSHHSQWQWPKYSNGADASWHSSVPFCNVYTLLTASDFANSCLSDLHSKWAAIRFLLKRLHIAIAFLIHESSVVTIDLGAPIVGCSAVGCLIAKCPITAIAWSGLRWRIIPWAPILLDTDSRYNT